MLIKQLNKSAQALLIILAVTPCLNPQTAAAAEKSGLTRAILLQNSITLPSNKIHSKMIRVSFPTGFKTPRHTHDGPGPRYVVKGTLQVVEGEKTGIYSAGEVFWESGQSMTVENVGGEPAELIIFELAPGH